MVLVLLIGDLHIPHRAIDLPPKFRALLTPGKIQQILCTGNLIDRETLDYLRTVSNDIQLVKGDFDDPYTLFSPSYHGQSLTSSTAGGAGGSVARQSGVDIVVVGGGDHRMFIKEHGGRLYINPGSPTGAYSAIGGEPVEVSEDSEEKYAEKVPSFVLLDVQGPVVVIYKYKLINDRAQTRRRRGGAPQPADA
ncbi:Metallo-dependent phosphatase [Ramicandelaber brevisporus]|nr:Metallo-dependent phosphatase [Ramicandelaber brevisporus]